MTEDSSNSKNQRQSQVGRRMLVRAFIVLMVLYILFPLIAGGIALGERDGPKFYFSEHHALLYEISYGIGHDDTPRETIFYERPWFYGMLRKKRHFAPGSKLDLYSAGMPEWQK